MRLLILSPIPYHPACGNGGGVICYHFLSALASRHEVHFLSFASANGQDDQLAMKTLSKVCAVVELIPMTPPNRLGRLVSRLAQMLGGPPVDALGFDSKRMSQAVNRITQTIRPDVVLIQFPYMAQYAAQVVGALRVMDVQDVFFVSRLREYVAQTNRVPRFKKMVSWLAWTQYELRHYSACDLLMAISERDEAALHALVPGVPAFTSPAAIQTSDSMDDFAPPIVGRIGFGGNFGHPPNVDALRWLIQEIAPAVAARFPEVEFHIVGKGIPPELMENAQPSLHFDGFVNDYGQFVRSCSAMIAPLRFGGGVKIKVLESLAYGRPVIASPIGAEGIPLGEAEGLICVRSVEDMVDRIVRHCAMPAQAMEAARQGARRVAELYGVEGKVRRFEAEIETLRLQRNVSAGDKPRCTTEAVS